MELAGFKQRGSSGSTAAHKYLSRDLKKSTRLVVAIFLLTFAVVAVQVPWVSLPTGPDRKFSIGEDSEAQEAPEDKDRRHVRSEEGIVFGDSSFGISYGEANHEDVKHWVLYNKPWKTGSTSISFLLRECFGREYKEVQFNGDGPSNIINPVTPALDFSKGKKLISTGHGRYNIAELRDLKQRSAYRNCYVTSVRDPIERIPSNALQILDGNIVRNNTYKKSADEMREMVCDGLQQMSPQYMVHYMTGMHYGREMNLTTEQTVHLAREVVATYDIILDKSGAVLYDSLNPACDETRQCFESGSGSEKMNSKLGDTDFQYACNAAMDRLVDEENKFFMGVINEIERINSLRG